MPMATPGRESGRMISRNTWKLLAPMSRAASMISLSILASEKKIGPMLSTT